MSGNRDFDLDRFLSLAGYFLYRGGWMPPEKLAWLMFRTDFDAYAQLGASITGATYLKGDRYPEVREVGIGWYERQMRLLLPWWTRPIGAAMTAYALWCTLRGR